MLGPATDACAGIVAAMGGARREAMIDSLASPTRRYAAGNGPQVLSWLACESCSGVLQLDRFKPGLKPMMASVNGDACVMSDVTLNQSEPACAVRQEAKSRLILVVDDSPLDRRLAGAILEQQSAARVIFATNGEEALEVVGREQPDLVLTDLQMPLMDGLALVESLRNQFPLTPAILMTGKGSEEIAIQALKHGAASYVPKRNLARNLADTVRDVLAVADVGRQQWRLGDFWSQTEFQFSLDNDAGLIPLLVAHVQQYLATVQHCDTNELLRVSVALHEALRNAMHHGNLELDSQLRRESPESYYQLGEQRRTAEPYRHRRVHITAAESRSEARYVIRDEGPGFDPAALEYDPTDAENLELPSGRGLLLMRMFMHEVQYNSRGNEITLVHRRADGAEGSPQRAQPNPK